MEPKESKILIKANSKAKVKIKFSPVYEYAVGEFFLYVQCENGAQIKIINLHRECYYILSFLIQICHIL
jgi:hypothetical protein